MQEFICSICINEPKEDNEKNDNRLTIVNGTLVCIDHVNTLADQIRKQMQRRRLLGGQN